MKILENFLEILPKISAVIKTLKNFWNLDLNYFAVIHLERCLIFQ